MTDDANSDANNIYTPHQRYVLLVVVLVGLGGLALYGLGSYALALLGAGILFVLLRPWFTALVSGRGWNRQVVTGLLLLLTVVVVVVPGYLFSNMLLSRLRNLSQYTAQAQALVQQLEKRTGISVINPQTAGNLLGQAADLVSGWLPRLAGSLGNLLIMAGLMLFTLYFMFAQEAAFLRNLRRYLPFEAATLTQLQAALQANVQANVLGQLLIAVVQGTLIGLTLWVFKVPDPMLWGTIGTFAAFIPMGTAVVWVPAALYQFAEGRAGLGVGILLAGVFVITGAEYALRIGLGRRLGNLHPLVTLLGITLGIGLFGVLGLVLGPLLLSYCGVLLEVFAQANRRRQGLEAAD